jgi:glycine/D-amino acid oxidase-like deaminating enzyme
VVDVIIVGAGIVGVACALYLQRDGRSVAIVDPEEPGENARTETPAASASGSLRRDSTDRKSRISSPFRTPTRGAAR